jgi:hypothetical protein
MLNPEKYSKNTFKLTSEGLVNKLNNSPKPEQTYVPRYVDQNQRLAALSEGLQEINLLSESNRARKITELLDLFAEEYTQEFYVGGIAQTTQLMQPLKDLVNGEQVLKIEDVLDNLAIIDNYTLMMVKSNRDQPFRRLKKVVMSEIQPEGPEPLFVVGQAVAVKERFVIKISDNMPIVFKKGTVHAVETLSNPHQVRYEVAFRRDDAEYDEGADLLSSNGMSNNVSDFPIRISGFARWFTEDQLDIFKD